MIDGLQGLRNTLRKLGDDLVHDGQVKGLDGLARVARRSLDESAEVDQWADWERRTLERVFDRMCSYGSELPRPESTAALQTTLEFIETFPDGRRRQVRNLLAVFEAGSKLLGPRGEHRRFTELGDEAADAYLKSWDESRLPPRRAAFRALKSVCMIGYWSQPETWAPIGYSLEANPGLDTSSNSP